MSMASRSGTVCADCCLRLARAEQSLGRVSTAHMQIRGKKKSARPTSIAVRLTKDVPQYGRKGTVVPLPIGMMRNVYYPQNLADYIAKDELKRLIREGTPIERDILFEATDSATSSRDEAAVEPKAPSINLKALSPREAFALLQEVIPPTLDFHRARIAPTEVRRPSEQATTAEEQAKEASPPPEMSPRQSGDNIYGSVSTEDINMAIKGLLHDKGLVGVVTLPDFDLKFVNIAGTDTESPRIKKLGEYDYEIRIRGFEEAMRRGVRVLPEEMQQTAQEIPPYAESVDMGGRAEAKYVQGQAA